MLLGFLSFPVLTRILPVAQYGQLSLLLKLGLLWTVLSKSGMQNAALRFFPEHNKRGSQTGRICASTLIMESILCAVLMGVLGLLLVHSRLFNLKAQDASLASVLLGLVAVRSVQPTLSCLLRAQGRTWLFNLCELSGKALGIGLSLAALFLLSVDLHYYIGGLLLAEGTVVLAVLVWFNRTGLLSVSKFSLGVAKSAWRFSVPLIAYELTSVILDSGDRILIGHYLGLGQLGLYSAAYSIATYAEEALMAPVNLSLIPAYMKVWVEQGPEATSRFLSAAMDMFIMAAGAVCVVVYVTAGDLIAVLASTKFSAARSLLPVLVCGLLVYALHIFFCAPLIIYKKSLALSAVTTVCCAANIAMNVIMLPWLGIMGAAIATLVSYAMLVAGLAVISRLYLSFTLPVSTFIICITMTVLIYSALMPFSTSSHWLNLAIKGPAAILLYTVGILLYRPALRSRILTWIHDRLSINSKLTVVDG
jgi:O-antigen/teichoic acid export membrane protein